MMFLTRTGGAAIPLPEHRGATGGPRAGDEGTHFLSPVAVTETTPVVPGIPVLVMLTVPRQTRLPHRILVIKLGGVILISVCKNKCQHSVIQRIEQFNCNHLL